MDITSDTHTICCVTIAEAATILRQSRRILVIGCSGGGKSTLAQKIAAHFGLPYVSMDREFLWLPGWVKRDKADERRLIAEAVVAERWIMDGSGASTFDLRLPRTELVIWVRGPRWECLLGVFTRVARHLGRTRPDMAPGCPEQFPDADFLSYIWNFERRFVPGILRNIERYGPDVPVVTVKSRGEMRRLLDLARQGA